MNVLILRIFINMITCLKRKASVFLEQNNLNFIVMYSIYEIKSGFSRFVKFFVSKEEAREFCFSVNSNGSIDCIWFEDDDLNVIELSCPTNLKFKSLT